LEEIKNGFIKRAIDTARTKDDNEASTLGLKVLGVKSMNLNLFEEPASPQAFLQKESLAAGATPATSNTTQSF
jgi:hypothetical protein